VSARGRGERAGLTREHILTTALELADRDGLKALSMRRLATALGVEAMTLYHYVPTKDALLDGLVETVFAQSHDGVREATPFDADCSTWLLVMTGYADTLRRTLLEHPGVLSLVIARPAVTPATLARVEEALALLTHAGFPLARAVDLINCLSLFVAAHAQSEIATAHTTDGSSAALARLDPTTYPLVVEAARTGSGVDDATRFRIGVRAILRGFELG
jgi:AcrR family transcriptional regulator